MITKPPHGRTRPKSGWRRNRSVLSKYHIPRRCRLPKTAIFEKERQLIATIADRIGQTASHRELEELLREFTIAGRALRKIQPRMDGHHGTAAQDRRKPLPPYRRKMIYHLFWKGVKDPNLHLDRYSFDDTLNGAESRTETNSPSYKQSRNHLLETNNHVFQVASRCLSEHDIMSCIQKWINESKTGFLAKTIGSGNARLSEIIDAIQRYKTMTDKTRHWPHQPNSGCACRLYAGFSPTAPITSISRNSTSILMISLSLQQE